jgi:hypothetical protein
LREAIKTPRIGLWVNAWVNTLDACAPEAHRAARRQCAKPSLGGKRRICEILRGRCRENVEIIRRLVDAWNRQDVEGILVLTHPEGEYVNAPTAVEPGAPGEGMTTSSP